jgi:hypothetical protein
MVILTGLCFACIACEVFIAYVSWGAPPQLILFLIALAMGIVGTWWRALDYHAKLRDASEHQVATKNTDADNALTVALDVGAEAMSFNLLFPYTVILLSLLWIGYLLRHCHQ